MRGALVRGLECAVAYGAVANVLTFVRPALTGPAGGTLAAPLVLQLLVTGFGVLATIALVLVFALIARVPITGFSRLGAAGIESSGVLSLGFAALVLGVANGQGVLLACAAVTVGVALVAGYQAAARPGFEAASHVDCWTAALLLIVVPYVADVGSFGWGPIQAGVAAAAAAACLAMAHLRFRGPLGARVPARVFALGLVLASAVGLSGAQVLRAAHGSGPREPVVRRVSASHPNVVLISMDTVRADHTGLHGYGRNTTPTLREEWLAGATLYTRAIATADWTIPSTASLLTGLLASHHGAFPGSLSRHASIVPNAPTLAELLRAGGFRTLGVAANHVNLRPALGFARGFDYYSCRPPSASFGVKPYLLAAAAWRRLPQGWRRKTRAAEDVTGEAVRLLRSAGGGNGGPFFLFLNYMDAHVPYQPPEDFRRRFGPPRPPFSLRRYAALESEVLSGTRHVTPDERRELEADYDAGIAYIDHNLRYLFDELRQLDLFDNSLILVTADHGEMFGESDIVGHCAGLFPELVHVPLLVKYPGQRHAATVEHAVSGADILPTVLAAVGLKPASRLDGHSLLEDPASGERVAISESFELDPLVAQNPRFVGDERAAFVGPLVYRVLRDASTVSERWQKGQQTASLLFAPPPRPDLIGELMALAQAAERPAPMPVRDPEVIEGLRSLGYLGR